MIRTLRTRVAWLPLLFIATFAQAQQLELSESIATDDMALTRAIPPLARQALALYRDDNRDAFLANRFRLQLAARQYAEAVATLSEWRAQHSSVPPAEPVNASMGVQLHARALALEAAERTPFEAAFRRVFRDTFGTMDDRAALGSARALRYPPQGPQTLQQLREAQKGTSRIAMRSALELVRAFIDRDAADSIAPLVGPLVAEDEARRYIVQDDVLIRTKEGATLSAFVVRSRRATGRQPTALYTTTQTDVEGELWRAKYAAARGYVGVSSDTRGKRLSPDEIVPYEHDAKDLYGVIDWISKQPWSDGQVGMWGGSISGFTQWAAAKTRHPALKTIVPYCAQDPGYGLPMLNNVFLTANYDWPFYTTNTRYLDEKHADRSRYMPMLWNWYRSGRPFREIDQVDGIPNKWLQRWLKHPAYDDYWQSMTVYGKDYDRLSIPILAIDGYYDDGQVNAVLRLQEHYKRNPKAQHYLVIGPYDHFDVQGFTKSAVLRGYAIDPVAHFDTPDLTFQWLDYVMKGGPKPAILKDRINYQVMGANVWKHAPSIPKMSSESLTLYLTDTREGAYYSLSPRKPTANGLLKQVVNFADRTTLSSPTYPSPIITRELIRTSGFAFVSEPFDAPISVNGLFTARLRAILNKKDFDIAMVLYEVMPNGDFFHLADTITRASYAEDMTRRKLLSPQMIETIPIERTLLVSRQLSTGSRLLLVLDVNKGPGAQINYGTGKDVSDESISDATVPLQVEWLTESYVKVPISR